MTKNSDIGKKLSSLKASKAAKAKTELERQTREQALKLAKIIGEQIQAANRTEAKELKIHIGNLASQIEEFARTNASAMTKKEYREQIKAQGDAIGGVLSKLATGKADKTMVEQMGKDIQAAISLAIKHGMTQLASSAKTQGPVEIKGLVPAIDKIAKAVPKKVDGEVKIKGQGDKDSARQFIAVRLSDGKRFVDPKELVPGASVVHVGGAGGSSGGGSGIDYTALLTSIADNTANTETAAVASQALLDSIESIIGGQANAEHTGLYPSELDADEEFTGSEFIDTKYIGHYLFLIAGLEDFATVAFLYSDDGVTLNGNSTTLTNKPTASGPLTYNVYLDIVSNIFSNGRYVTTHIINGSTPQSSPALVGISTSGKFPYIPTIGIDADISFISEAILTRAVNAAVNPNNQLVNVRAQGPDDNNSTTTLLNGDTGGTDHIWRGQWFEIREGYVRLEFAMKADVLGTLYIDLSQETSPANDVDDDITDSNPLIYDPAETTLLRRTIVLQSRWVRLRYVNDTTAQSIFTLGATFMVTDSGLGLSPYAVLPSKGQMAGMVRSITGLETEDGEGYQEHKGRPDGSATQTITGMETEVQIKAVKNLRVGQASITSALPTLFPGVTDRLPGRKTIEVSNHSAVVNVFWSPEPDMNATNSKLLRAGSDVPIDVDEFADIYWIAEDTGGSVTQNDLIPTSAGGTATSPNNLLASDDVYASLTLAQTLIATFSGYTKTLDNINSVGVKVEAKKASTPATQTVAFEEIKEGTTSGATSVASASLAGGTDQLYVVGISRNAANNISGVSGGGLTFQSAVVNQVNGGRSLDLWWAYGTPTAGAITATMSSNTSAHIQVLRLSGADASTTVEGVDATTGTGATVTGPNIAKTALGMGVTFVSHESNTPITAGTGYTKRGTDLTTGSGSNTNRINAETKGFSATGSEAATMSLGSSSDWIAASIRVIPAATVDTTYDVDIDYGTGYINAGELTFDATETEQLLDLSGIMPMTQAAVNSTNIRLTRTSAGVAVGQVDHIKLFIEEGADDTAARLSFGEAADPDNA